MDHYDILIIGGGYGGVMCALRLAGRLRRKGVKIGLVNPRPQFVERLRLHEGLTRPTREQLRSFSLEPWLGTRNISFVEGQVETIDRANWTVSVHCPGGHTTMLGYGQLVLATGSKNVEDRIQGQKQHAFTLELGTKNGVDALHKILAETNTPSVLVIGGGATGLEVAAEIALKSGADVTLVDSGKFATYATPGVARLLKQKLPSLGVSLLENTRVTSLENNIAETATGTLPFDICVVCAGFRPPAFLAESGLEVDNTGRVRTDAFLRALNDKRIYVVGDACMPSVRRGAPPRMSVFFALTSGAHIADAIADEGAGKRKRPFGFWTYGQAYGLGRHAIGYANFPHDRAFPPYYTGRIGFHLRVFFVWLLFAILCAERRWPGLPFYLGRPLERPRDQTSFTK